MKFAILGMGFYVAACGGGQGATGTDGNEASPAEQAPTASTAEVIASVQLTATRRVEFRELGEGAVAIDDVFHADLDAATYQRLPVYDSLKGSLVDYYRNVCALSEQHVSPNADDVARLAAVDAKIAEAPAPVRAESPDGVGQVRSALSSWGDFNDPSNPAFASDYTWFVKNWCTTPAPTDYCQVGLVGLWSAVSTQRTTIFTFFNENYTDDGATQYIQLETCNSFTHLCSNPGVVYSSVVPHRWVRVTNAFQYSGDHKWHVNGTGNHWGRGIIFDN